MKPNIGRPQRIAYVLFGILLCISPLLIPLQPWLRVVAVVMGIATILGGITGL